MNRCNHLGKVSKFVKTLYRIVNDKNIPEIRWSEDGQNIRIVNKEKFVKNVLNLLSKTKEYSAFVRQLNMYGFIKAKNYGDNGEEYYNKNFQRDREEALLHVKREIDRPLSLLDGNNNRKGMDELYDILNYLTKHNYKLENEISELKDRMSKQEQTIDGLIDILSRVFRVGMKASENTNFLEDNTRMGSSNSLQLMNYGRNNDNSLDCNRKKQLKEDKDLDNLFYDSEDNNDDFF